MPDKEGVRDTGEHETKGTLKLKDDSAGAELQQESQSNTKQIIQLIQMLLFC